MLRHRNSQSGHDAREQSTEEARRSLVQSALARPRVRRAIAVACAAIASAGAFVAVWHLHSIAMLVVLAPSTIVVCGLLASFALAPIAPASCEESPQVTGDRAPLHLSGYRWGQTMTVCRSEDRWFLENERGELYEAPFVEVVEWLDTLWDVRQLAVACPESVATSPSIGRSPHRFWSACS